MSARTNTYPVMVDTNIIIYSTDKTSGAKHEASIALLGDLIEQGTLALSTQIVREYSNVYLKKLGNKDAGSLLVYLKTVLEPSVRIYETQEMIYSAVLLTVEFGISFYDALILQSAIDLGCETLYTEDFQHGREYSGVKVVNPFI